MADAESLWGVHLAALGRYDEAEPLLLAAYETIHAAKGRDDISTVTARKRIRALYEIQGLDSEAAKFADTQGKDL